MRKKKLFLGAIPVLIFFVLLISSSRKQSEKICRWSLAGIIPVEIKIYNSAVSADTVFDACRKRLTELELLFNRYRSDSEVSRINRKASEKPFPVSEDMFSLLTLSNELNTQTSGAFDITVVPLMVLWKNAEQADAVPDSDTIRRVRSHTGTHHIILDADTQTVVLTNSNLRIDLGGISKGYMVDRLVELLKENDVQRGLVNIGGDLRVFGGSPEDPFRVGITDPETPGRIIRTLTLTDSAVATSGDYERYTTIQGRRFSHIIDPRTGMPVTHSPSVTVIAPDGVRADAYATAFSVLGPDASLKLASAETGIDFIMGHRENGRLNWTTSAGMHTYVQKQ